MSLFFLYRPSSYSWIVGPTGVPKRKKKPITKKQLDELMRKAHIEKQDEEAFLMLLMELDI